MSRRFILASSSPRRIELLREAGFDFDIEPADIDESDVPRNLSPLEVAEHLALAKAMTVARRHFGRRESPIVLGADTIVAVGSEMFGKAETRDMARQMLRRLSGTRQTVITGLALVGDFGNVAALENAQSVVEMKVMSDAEIDVYVATDQWRGKAGAYGIQDHDPESDPFVRLISGHFDNVVGLPVRFASSLLRSVGIVRRSES